MFQKFSQGVAVSAGDDCEARRRELRDLTLEQSLKYAHDRHLAWITNSPEYWNWEDHEVIRNIIFGAETAAELLAHIPVEVKLAAFKKIDEAKSTLAELEQRK